MIRLCIASVLLLGIALGAVGCGSPSTAAPRPATATNDVAGMSDMSGMGDMAGMGPATTPNPPGEAAPEGNGLADAVGAYTFVPTTDTLPPNTPSTSFTFRITGPGGRTVTRYQPYESQLVLFDLIRSDLTGYTHVNPAMRQDGTWTVPLPALTPGSYRAYVTFAAPDSSAGTPLVYRLSHAFTVPGSAPDATLPAPATTTTVDGFAVTLSGRPTAGSPAPLTIDISRNGQPVGYFQRYLDGYAHLIAFRSGDLAVARLSPAGKITGQQRLTSQAMFPSSGSWRLFVQFQTSGPPHTAVFTVVVG